MRYLTSQPLSVFANVQYFETLKRYLAEYDETRRLNSKLVLLDVNRRMLNLLSSVRMYLDHSETSIRREYGEDSSNLRSFKKSVGEAYDGNFSYRLLYELRNFGQHVGLPIGKLSYGVRPSDDNPKTPTSYLELGIDRDKLLSSFDWNKSKKYKSLKKEIESQPAEINPSVHLRSMMQSLSEINLSLTRDQFKALRPHAEYISLLFARLDCKGGRPCVLEFELVEDEAGNVVAIAGISALPVRMDIVSAVANDRLEDLMEVAE